MPQVADVDAQQVQIEKGPNKATKPSSTAENVGLHASRRLLGLPSAVVGVLSWAYVGHGSQA